MFKRRYIFETKQTRGKRYLHAFCFTILSCVSFYLFLCLYFIHVAENERQRYTETFFKKSPDLIAIYTGDAGRISYGLRKSLEHQTANVLISGVYNSNSIKTILMTRNDKILQSIDLDSHHIEIDYLARNTIENVLSTLRFIRKEKIYHKILIVSHDYHIFRIRYIIDKLKEDDGQYVFYYLGIPGQYNDWRNIRILAKEVFKTLKAVTFLMLWDVESSSELGTEPLSVFNLNSRRSIF